MPKITVNGRSIEVETNKIHFRNLAQHAGFGRLGRFTISYENAKDEASGTLAKHETLEVVDGTTVTVTKQ